MSTQKKFDDIINQFASDEEDENDSDPYDKNDNKIIKHKSTSSLTENMNNKIKDILPNIKENVQKEEINKKRKRDQFGYFINNDENDDSEESNSNNVKQEQERKNYTDSSDNDSSGNKNENENENNDNEIISIHEEENKSNNNFENNSENNIYNNESQDKKENENNIIEKEENSEKKEIQNMIIENDNNNSNNNIKAEEDEHVQKDEETDLINELYNKSINHENLDSVEGEAFRMNSFRPNPIPGSPKFTQKISDNININNFNLNSNETINIQNNNSNNNNNLPSFTETIETKIEGNLNTKNSIKIDDTNINKKDLYNQIYTHNSNIISLGKMPNKENYINSDSIQKSNIINTNESIKIIKNNNIDDLNEEKEEEAFLKRE